MRKPKISLAASTLACEPDFARHQQCAGALFTSGIWRPDGSTYRVAEQAVKLGLNAEPLLLVRFGAVAPAALKQAFLLLFQTASRIICAAGRSLSAETLRRNRHGVIVVGLTVNLESAL
jgi:hypothetical protein